MSIGQVGGYMCWLYILQSKLNNTYYIGSTNDISRREKEHYEGRSKYTCHIRPLNLVFKQEFNSLKEARKAEINLNRFKSRKIIEQIVKDQKIKSAAVVQR